MTGREKGNINERDLDFDNDHSNGIAMMCDRFEIWKCVPWTCFVAAEILGATSTRR